MHLQVVVLALALVCFGGAVSAENSTADMSVSSTTTTVPISTTTTTTTTTIPNCGPITLLETLDNAVSSGNCSSAEPGQMCRFECTVGHVSAFPLTFWCDAGLWVQTDGERVEDSACVDHDECATNPCNDYVSDCVDAVAPETGHTCVCKPNHVGSPGRDGSGCSRVTILTVDGNIMLRTGEGHDIGFVIGEEQFTASELSAAVVAEIVRADSTEESLATALESSIDRLTVETSTSQASLASALSGNTVSLAIEIDRATSTLSSGVAGQLSFSHSSLTAAIEDVSGELGEDIDSQASLLSAASASILSNAGSISSMSVDVDSQFSTVTFNLDNAVSGSAAARDTIQSELSAEFSSALRGSVASLTGTISTTAQSLAAAVTTAQNTANANTGRFGSYYTKTQVYTKAETDALIAGVTTDYENYVSSNFLTKSAASSTYATPGYVAQNYYTKSQTNSLYPTKTFLSQNHYTKTESNGRYNTKAGAASLFATPTYVAQNYYSKAYVNSNFYTKSASSGLFATQSTLSSNYYTSSYLNSVFASKTYTSQNYYSRSSSDSRYYTKTYISQNYYSASTYDSRAVWPLTSGRTEDFSILPTNWMQGHSYYSYYNTGNYVYTHYQSHISVNEGAYRFGAIYSYAMQYLNIPTNWYLYGVSLYGSSSSPDLYVIVSRYSSSYHRSICSSSSINRYISCNGYSYRPTYYATYLRLQNISASWVIYGGYYRLRRV